jgi:hypothetical protein
MGMGPFLFKSGIRTKINLGIMTIVLVSVLLIALAASQIVSRALFKEYQNRGISLSVNLAARSEDPILAMDLLRMRSLIGEVTTSAGDILYAFIQDPNGESSQPYLQRRVSGAAQRGQPCPADPALQRAAAFCR